MERHLHPSSGEHLMYMNDYQTAARRTAMGNSLDHFVMGLAEEAGEVAGGPAPADVQGRFWWAWPEVRK